MVYQWKTPLYKVSADVAGAEVEGCRNVDGVITPASVVERATPTANPLHPCFEWDNDKAAIKWREQEARVLIGNLVTVIKTDSSDEPPMVVRAFVNTNGNDGKSYKDIVTVLKHGGDREYLLARAKSELESFMVKYGKLSELAAVFKAIGEVL